MLLFCVIFTACMSTNNRVVVSVTNDLVTDNRVDKVCTFLVSQGYEVLLVGRKRRKSPEMPRRDYATKRMRLLFEKGPFFYAEYNFRLFWLLLFRKANVLVSNDLDTLLANYLTHKLKGGKLVYDSHEFYTEVPELVSRPRVRRIWLSIEKWIFPKLKLVYTVNESIADAYNERYGLLPKVVRNISPKYVGKDPSSKKELGIPENKKLIILQGAGINIHRGAEEAVEAMRKVDNALLLIVGDGDVIPQLKETVEKENLSDKVLFFGRRPYLEMMQFTAHSDLGLTLDKDNNLNYKFSLPNKVFDYIHAGTPIVCTDLVEVAKVVRRNDVGVVLNEFTVDHLADALNTLLKDEKELSRFKENCRLAAEKENWEKECEVLNSIYPKIEN